MKITYNYILLFFVIISACHDVATPSEPDLPIETDLITAQSVYIPQYIAFVYDTAQNAFGMSTFNERSVWGLNLTREKLANEINLPFSTIDLALAHPDGIYGSFQIKGGEGLWITNKLDQLIELRIDSLYEDSNKTYCSGYVEFLTTGSQAPFTIPIKGSFSNIRFFYSQQDIVNYRIMTQLSLQD